MVSMAVDDEGDIFEPVNRVGQTGGAEILEDFPDLTHDDVRACLGAAVFETVIPRNVRLSEAPSHGLPALIYDLRCAGSEAYLNLARELMARLPQRAEAA